MKKYNNSTKCYKIDIYVNGIYNCSTDQSKTCKEAKQKFLSILKHSNNEDVKCHFAKNI